MKGSTETVGPVADEMQLLKIELADGRHQGAVWCCPNNFCVYYADVLPAQERRCEGVGSRRSVLEAGNLHLSNVETAHQYIPHHLNAFVIDRAVAAAAAKKEDVDEASQLRRCSKSGAEEEAFPVGIVLFCLFFVFGGA